MALPGTHAPSGADATAVEVVIALGSNLGDRRAHLAGAVEALRARPGVSVLRVSPWVETAAVGGPPDQGPYLNGVLIARCTLAPAALLGALQEIERAFGRERDPVRPHAARTLDLDLLLYGEQRVDEPGLVVPHPRLEERLFVLEPLARVAPERILPGSGKTVRQRLSELRAARRAAPASERRSSSGA
jgi:2-amino-4-hydroxy-6-hydroxymethyldihydropteridine diphosphokinase